MASSTNLVRLSREQTRPGGLPFALLAMLADKYAANKIVQDFAVDLIARFNPEIQLVV
jgi:hypothetical protein